MDNAYAPLLLTLPTYIQQTYASQIYISDWPSGVCRIASVRIAWKVCPIYRELKKTTICKKTNPHVVSELQLAATAVTASVRYMETTYNKISIISNVPLRWYSETMTENTQQQKSIWLVNIFLMKNVFFSVVEIIKSES